MNSSLSTIDPVRPDAVSTILASTSVGLAAVAIPSGKTKMKVTNVGPNKAFVSVSPNSAGLAVLPTGAAFTAEGIPVGLNETISIDLTKRGRDVNGQQWFSAICSAAETASLLVCAW